MHPAISLMLRDPRTRAAIERALAARGQHGDTMLIHANPREAAALKAMGGAGTINPKTGLLQFFAGGPGGVGRTGGGAVAGGAGVGGGGSNGGGLGGRPGDSNGGYNGQGRGFSGPGGGTTGGDLGPGQTRAGESAFDAATKAYNDSFWGHIFGAQPSLNNGTSYADGTWHTGFNPGALAGGIVGSLVGAPGLGLLSGWGYRQLGGSDTVLGGPGAPATEGMDKGLGFGPNPNGGGNWGSGGANNSGGPSNGRPGGDWGSNPGDLGRPGEVPGAGPAPAVPPAGVPAPLAATPPLSLAGLYSSGMAGDPFAGRFGINPGLLPYLIAAGQPQGGGFLSGMIR